MFKSPRIVQAGCLAALLSVCATLSACATKQTAVPPSNSTPNTAPGRAAPPASGSQAHNAGMPKALPSIQAGFSRADAGPLRQANGTLVPEIQAFADELSRTRGIPLEHVERLLASADYNATAARLMSPSSTRVRRSWVTYRKRFVEPIRIRNGVEFWSQHRLALDGAAREYGVPASIIAAIIGVETLYGRHTGNFSVLDALTTLGFRYPDAGRPERSQMFRDQLADLIQLDYAGKIDALTAQGSFAGAMGLPQFMPGSLLRYAADGNGDGKIDLLNNVDDAIFSVARFLREHGWQRGVPVFAPVALPSNAQSLVSGGLEPTLDWQTLKERGATRLPSTGNYGTAWQKHRLGIVDLVDEPRKTVEYRTGTPNFFALTHYNRSYFYAASVADLAQELANRMKYDNPY
ncbi:MAG: lytic murein transglycosylase B [Candidimonas sp.]